MSTLAITAAHFVGLPVRYVVGRWSNLSTSTLLVFNATDLGLHILVRSILGYAVQKHHWKISNHLATSIALSTRVVYCLAAVYVTSKLTKPMPLEIAVLTNLAAFVAIYAAYFIAKWIKG
jgi:hypothetical protein